MQTPGYGTASALDGVMDDNTLLRTNKGQRPTHREEEGQRPQMMEVRQPTIETR